MDGGYSARPEDMRESVLISSSIDQHVEWLSYFIEIGFTELQIHQVDHNQRGFIETFGTHVLPQLRH